MFSNYYIKAKSFAVYPNDTAEDYLCLGQIGEVGETAEKIKKLIRDTSLNPTDPSSWPADTRELVSLELGDVCWYLIVHYYDVVAPLLCSGEEPDENEFLNIEKFNLKYREILYTIKDVKAPKVNPTFAGVIIYLSAVVNTFSFGYDTFDLDYKLTDDDKEYILATAFATIAYAASLLGYTFGDILDMNIEKLTSRSQRDRIHGNGDKR